MNWQDIIQAPEGELTESIISEIQQFYDDHRKLQVLGEKLQKLLLQL